ncbi:MAG: efflux RND transporter periplasmic adaptor subunit, partial [Rhodoferax sp.]|nr:efflux RND transporter periplasmic adaptor subunit [Rhodoferax sp.]
RAEIQQAKAQVSIAQSNYQRNQELVAQNFVAQRVLEESSANLQVAQAQLALAEARLARMRIVAPFDGTVGLRNINLGDYVKDGADLVNLEDLSRMVVDFRLPERYQNKLRVQQTVELVLDAFPDRTFSARIEALDPLLDANGRSVGVRAMLPNTGGQERASAKSGATPERKPAEATAARRASGSSLAQASGPLRPGMFARVTAVFGVNEAALVVPEEAIVPQGGRQYVVRVLPAPAASGEAANAQAGAASALAQGISQRQEVKLGVRQLGRVEITQGLSLGETVVVAGQQRLQKDGTPVRIVELGKPGERDQGGATARGSGGAAAAKPPAAASSAAQP